MKLCIALDKKTMEENLALANNIKQFDIWLKVGLRSYVRDGAIFIKELKKINCNFKIFLDLKLYDIPNTMADTAEEIAKLNIDMFNIHASAGKIAMQAVMERLSKFKNIPLVLAVTALTSFDNKDFKSIYGNSINNKVVEFAKDSYKAGLNGVVCSAFESQIIKKETKMNFITLSPGIRPFGENSNDQKRVANISLAQKELVDFIVIGRPIYNSNNPRTTVQRILETINQ
jgi:orotidine-5'-phosphate decarboxylase